VQMDERSRTIRRSQYTAAHCREMETLAAVGVVNSYLTAMFFFTFVRRSYFGNACL
jgi:hypothetical protein